jgi:hypothetical protein
VKAPLELEALAYLPPEYQLLAGLHLRELLQDPTGKRLLADPLPGLDLLLKRTGLRLDQIDHVAAAGQLDKRATRATVVVRTILPYDQQTVSQAVQPAKASLRQKQPLFQFALPTPGTGYLWCVDERTLILAFVLETANPDPLHDVPATPQPARELPTPLLKRAATERLDRQSRLWLAVDLEAATVLGDLLALAGGMPKDLAPLAKVKALTAGVYPQDGVTLLAQLYTGDPKAAKAVESLLEARRWPEAKSYKVEGPPPGETAVAAQWVTLQVRSDAETMRDLLERIRNMKRK